MSKVVRKGIAVVWSKPEKEWPIRGDVKGQIEWGDVETFKLTVLHGEDGSDYALEVVTTGDSKEWVPRKILPPLPGTNGTRLDI